jgi:myo-inositol 2-dehydrogenase/D-chiro-inositol 1-dehydrogenase
VTVRVGVIGVGAIGQDHVRRLTETLRGARVVAVSDVDAARARAVAARVPGARAHPTGEELIRQEDVDAIVVTTSGATHAEYVLDAIGQGKPVFCEKPLAPTTEPCLQIMQAEMSRGRRLVQVGFMRRYDAGYRAMKEALEEGTLGAPLLVHCAHRNASVPPGFSTNDFITDAAIHEIDIVRWLLGQEIAATQVLLPRRTSRASRDLQDPQVVILETAEGALVDIEVFANAAYGYDIRCEVVCEEGTVALSDASPVVSRRNGLRSDHVPAGWKERFVRAYDTELQAWIDSVGRNETTGPGSWEGYAATAVAVSAVNALQTRQRTPVQLIDRPGFYT